MSFIPVSIYLSPPPNFRHLSHGKIAIYHSDPWKSNGKTFVKRQQL